MSSNIRSRQIIISSRYIYTIVWSIDYKVGRVTCNNQECLINTNLTNINLGGYNISEI